MNMAMQRRIWVLSRFIGKECFDKSLTRVDDEVVENVHVIIWLSLRVCVQIIWIPISYYLYGINHALEYLHIQQYLIG